MKKLLCMLIAFCIVLSVVPSALITDVKADSSELPFTDVKTTDWFYESVKYAYENGLMKGTSATEFSPKEKFSRAMLVTVLWRLEGEPTAPSASFSDVMLGKWYSDAIAWASDAEIVNGYGYNNKFGPDDPLTREQMVTIFYRYAPTCDVDTTGRTELSKYDDAATVSNFAKDAVSWAVYMGIIKGFTDTTLNPKGNANRAEAATIFQRFCNLIPPESDVPKDEQQSADNATEQSKYSFDNNPLLNSEKTVNMSYMPSLDLDDTAFVRAGTKLSDLMGKTLYFYTADNYATWSYRDSTGSRVDEWTWFELLKKELGLNVKYEVRQHQKSVDSALQAMNAGKQCDIIMASRIVYPSVLCISKPITELININNNGSSPGINKKAMDITKWGGSYRVIAPIGGVDVLWYNETLVSELELSDPRTLLENSNWNWDTFKAFMQSVPDKTADETELTALVQWPSASSSYWPSTNGKDYISIDADASTPTIINNWDAPDVMEAWEFICDVQNSINYRSGMENSAGSEAGFDGLFEGTTVMSSTMYPVKVYSGEYSDTAKLNWVPYPANKGAGIDNGLCFFNGVGMLLPKKTVKANNVNIALKFMELWATRATESIIDNLSSLEYYGMSYKEIKDYFDFAASNVAFPLAMSDFSGSDLSTETNFFKCFKGDDTYDVSTEASKASTIVQMHIIETLKYGQ